jgi:ribonuclease HII
MLSMRRSVESLFIQPSKVLVDGNRVPDLTMPAAAIIGGDDSVQEIAAASIIAKVVRDRMMGFLGTRYPAYQFARHKGYGTKVHMDALREHGPCPVHRKSFAPVAKLVGGEM